MSKISWLGIRKGNGILTEAKSREEVEYVLRNQLRKHIGKMHALKNENGCEALDTETPQVHSQSVPPVSCYGKERRCRAECPCDEEGVSSPRRYGRASSIQTYSAPQLNRRHIQKNMDISSKSKKFTFSFRPKGPIS